MKKIILPDSFVHKTKLFVLMCIILSSSTQNSFAQATKTVKGKITDQAMLPLPGVSVIVKGTVNGVSSDKAGNYVIQKVPENGVLVFTMIGMETQEITVAKQSAINVTMREAEAVGVDEVVVVGFGTVKKESLTAAVSSVKGDELRKSASVNISNNLAGRISGITAIQDDGSPGRDQARIYIRGLATTGNVDPLYVIDGIARSSADFQRLAPSEVENISVLKDAAAAAVYGARGANGVILITTKRGSNSVATLNYSYNFGLQKATKLPDYLDSYGYAKLYNIARENEGSEALYLEEDLNLFKDGSDPIFHPNTDWLDPMRGTAPVQRHNLNLSGGQNNIRYFLSFDYMDQKSTFSKENNDLGYKKYNFRSNIDVDATKTTKVSFDISGYFGDLIEPGSGYGTILSNIARIAPVYAGRYPNGMFAAGWSNMNPWPLISESGYLRYKSYGFLSRFEVKQELPFIDGLAVRGIASFDYRPEEAKQWRLSEKRYNAERSGDDIIYRQVTGFGTPALDNSRNSSDNLTLEAHLLYNKSFGKHDVGGLLLYSQQHWQSSNLKAFRSGFLSDKLDIIDVGSKEDQDTGGSASQSKRQSIVGRFSYGYDKKYLAELNFRYDGSDIFAKGNRFGFFPAVSLGWIVSEESFMKSVGAINFLKIRGSYGVLGNDQIGRYQHLEFYNFGSGVAMGDPTSFQNNIYLSRLANTDVTWEKAKKTNVGFETRFLNDFNIEADYFFERRNDILGQRAAIIPGTSGATTDILPYENFQIVQNQGFEIVVGYNKSINKNLDIQSRLSITHTKNKIIDIGEPADKREDWKWAGKSLNPQWGYKALGFFQSEEEIKEAYENNHPNLKPGDIRYADLNNDKKIDGDDQTYIGSNDNLPVNIFGWNSNIRVKNFEFSMFWQAGTGGKRMFWNWMAIPFNQAGKALKRHEDYWSPTNRAAKFPRITTSSAWNYDNTTDFWFYDLSYLRLKNIELAYSLPRSVCSKISAQNIRVYTNASNLLTFSKYTEIDPETNALSYATQKIFNFGVQITF